MAELTEALTRHFNFVAKVRKPYLGVTAVDELILSYIPGKIRCGACGEAVATGTYKCNGCSTIVCGCGACDCWRSPKLSLVPALTQADPEYDDGGQAAGKADYEKEALAESRAEQEEDRMSRGSSDGDYNNYYPDHDD